MLSFLRSFFSVRFNASLSFFTAHILKKAVYDQVEHAKNHFEDLFKYKEALEKQVAALVANVSGRLKIPVDRILQMVNSNTLLISDNNECLFDIVKSDSELMLVNIMGKDNPNDPQSQNESQFTKQNFRPNFKKFHSISLIDILYRHKLSVFYNAKRERYIKSVMEYETKIKNLKTSALKKVQNNIVGCEKMRNIELYGRLHSTDLIFIPSGST